MTTAIPTLRVLYVEDNPVDLDLTKRELARHAPEIVLETATTIVAALELLKPTAPLFDVLLTDLSLPDGSGLELLAHIRELELPIAVVIITGSGDQETAVAALKAGADNYLVKRTKYLGTLSIVLSAAYSNFQYRNKTRSKPLKVLYADANDLEIDVTRGYFARHSPHISLEVVHDGIEVLSRLPVQDVDSGSHYDALLLDYQLPGMNALEIAKELRQIRGIDIPIVLITAQGSEDIALVALRLGVEEYLVKYDGYYKQLTDVIEKLNKQSELNKSEKRYRHLYQLLKQREQELKDLNKILENRIEERTSQLSLATDSAHIGVWDYLVVENKLSWNKWMYVLYGIDEGGFTGTYAAWSRALHPDDLARCEAEIQMSLRGEKEFDIEFRLVWLSGEIRHIRGTALVQRDANGVAQRMIGVNYDVTSLKRAEAALSALNKKLCKQVEVADKANLAKSAFVANMSHEIRTPMNSILGLTYLLQKAPLPYHEKELVNKVHTAGHTLLSIVNDILDFSKIEAGHMKIEQVPFLLKDLMDYISTLMASAVGNKKIELIITPPLVWNLRLCGDSLRLGQILINLVGNAIKFTEQGHVEAAITVMGETENHITLRFSVRDSGIGISPDKQNEIFLSFTQADVSTTRHFGGTGLGLAICRRLVELMGGLLEVSSTPGVGSEFSFTLTFERLPMSAISSEDMRQVDILIADDNVLSLESLRITAAGLGWNTTTVSSGEDLVNSVLKRKCRSVEDLVLLVDMDMPSGMNGLTAIHSIRETLCKNNVTVIIMIRPFAREEFLAHPGSHLVDAILSKPITSSGLYNCVLQIRTERRNGYTLRIQQPQERRLDGVRILVVDDSDINRDVAEHIFADEGAQVAIAENGQQAINWLLAHPDKVDIVLMDIQMPVMDGYETTSLIRAIPEFADLPVVALTAGVFLSHKEEARNAGMTDYITKPFDVELAITMILRLTNRLATPARILETPANSSVGSDQDLPGILVGRGLKIWKDKKVYQQYLLKFVRDYKDVYERIAQDDKSEASALAHKLKGVAGSLALDEIAECAGEVEHLIILGEVTTDATARLLSALEITLRSIKIFAPSDLQKTSHSENGNFDSDHVGKSLSQMLKAFNSDPDYVMPVLTVLSRSLSSERLNRIYMAVENLDFRGGEMAVRLLAAELGVAIEEVP